MTLNRNAQSEKSDFAACSVDHGLVLVNRFNVPFLQRFASVPFAARLILLIDCTK